MMTLSLLADIGGTNTRVALAGPTGALRPDSFAHFANKDYAARGQDIHHILRDYLAQTAETVAAVCVAAAGPVEDGVATMTNLRWRMDAGSLSAATGAARVAILNDLQAQGHALGHIAPDQLHPLVAGPARNGAPMLVVGLGTGVNAAPVHDTPRGRIVPSSECGHVNMPVRCQQDLDLADYLAFILNARGETPHAGVEEVLSGRGLANLHAFVSHEEGRLTRATSRDVIEGLAADDQTALQAGQLYTRLLGQVLADLALIHLPYGGLYLIGGMARAMTPHLERFGLADHFREARRVDLLQRQFSVTVVEDDNAALVGCAAALADHRG